MVGGGVKWVGRKGYGVMGGVGSQGYGSQNGSST